MIANSRKNHSAGEWTQQLLIPRLMDEFARGNVVISTYSAVISDSDVLGWPISFDILHNTLTVAHSYISASQSVINLFKSIVHSC